MATIVYKRAKCFLNDAQLDAQLSELNLEYKAEMLDATVFGLNTRTHKGGLLVATINAKGYFDGSVGGIDQVLFDNAGVDEWNSTSGLPTVATIFPDGITEGTTTNFGYAMKGVVDGLSIGGTVGTLLPLTFAVYSRGVNR